LCSSPNVSQGYVSSRRRSNRFRFFSCNGALLGCVLVCYCSEAAKESVYDSTCVKQVFERAECLRPRGSGIPLGLCGQSKICRLRRDHRFAAIRQDQNQIHSTFATYRLPNSEGLALKGMTNPSYGDSLGKVLMMGSVSWFPWIVCGTTCCWRKWRSGCGMTR
jgi:hypothetical protein